jgi:hypothetical protein
VIEDIENKISKMSDIVFIPTPNWFISNSIDINPVDGSCAITAINSVLFTRNLLNKFDFTIREAHTKRIQGVSFFRTRNSGKSTCNFVATCSEDFDIKVWDADNAGVLLDQHKLHQVI